MRYDLCPPVLDPCSDVCMDDCAACCTQGPSSPDHPRVPCCRNGSCSGCQAIAGDAPWFYPRVVGCGKLCLLRHDVRLALTPLDRGVLPGRAPHRVVCVSPLGGVRADNVGGGAAAGVCDSGTITMDLHIPVAVTVEDCAGFRYLLRGELPGANGAAMTVSIPICGTVRTLGGSLQLYTKVRVSLCEPLALDDTCDDPSDGAIDVPVNVSVQACLARLIPYGTYGPCNQRPNPPWVFTDAG